jgi:hypothetical protein
MNKETISKIEVALQEARVAFEAQMMMLPDDVRQQYAPMIARIKAAVATNSLSEIAQIRDELLNLQRGASSNQSVA